MQPITHAVCECVVCHIQHYNVYTLQVLVQGFQAMNAHSIATGTQEVQLPVLPDPAMNLKLTQQQQQQQQQQKPQEQLPQQLQEPQKQQEQLPQQQQVPDTKPIADIAGDSKLVQAGAEKVQQIAEGTVDTVSNAAGAQV